VAGLLAGFVKGEAEVTLRAPPPLEKPLNVVPAEGGVALMDGDKLIAEAAPTEFEVDAPVAPSWEEAVAAAARGKAKRRNEQYNMCFVCGLDRGPGDGLCIFPGALHKGETTMAATWAPDATIAHPDGIVPPEFVWAALDCPSGFPYIQPDGVVVLGRFAVKRQAAVRRDERYILLGWRTEIEGRRMNSASALYTADGALCAVARATWIKIEGETP